MANTFKPFGALPEMSADGASPTYGMRNWNILYSNTDEIYRGDLVKQVAGGYIEQWDPAVDGSLAAGVFWGCKYYSVSQQTTVFSKYWPGADVATNAVVTAYVIPINTAVAPMFVIQTGNSAGAAVAVTQADIGQTADVAMGDGDAQSGMSTMYLDINTFGTQTTKPFKIVSLYPGVGNGADAASAYNWVIVQANPYGEAGI